MAVNSIQHEKFITTTGGLNRDVPPMRLYEKAKKFGIWNPAEIDFAQDKADWATFDEQEQKLLLHLTSLFIAGEEAVTLDLLPLMFAIANEGRTEEEMYLTTFLFEESKHVDFFQRLLNDVMGIKGEGLSHFHSTNYRMLFYDALPTTLKALMTDASPEAQVRASVTYNMIVEGVMAETGYHAYYTVLKNNDLMPGAVEGIQKLQQDESRHIAYGIFLISRLVAEHPDLWDVAESTMNSLLMPAMSIIQDIFDAYDPMPFGLNVDDFTGFAMMQFQKRMARIEKARGAGLEDVYRVTQQAIENNDA